MKKYIILNKGQALSWADWYPVAWTVRNFYGTGINTSSKGLRILPTFHLASHKFPRALK